MVARVYCIENPGLSESKPLIHMTLEYLLLVSMLSSAQCC